MFAPVLNQSLNMDRLACIISALLFTIAFQPLSAQEVWPGDANNNGIANAVDALYIGVAYGTEGPERDDATTDWEAQPFELWGAAFPDGTNYGYADADGDGEIDAYGRLVWTAPPELLLPVGDARRIPLHHLPPGTYRLQGRSPNGQLHQKVVVH